MKVRIYRPAKTAMQSGRAKTHAWLLEGTPDARKDPNPLTGWVMGGDTFGQIRMTFASSAAAEAYAAAQGWDYTVLPFHERTLKIRSYAENFTHPPQ